MTSESPFLALPREIRDHIYVHALEPTHFYQKLDESDYSVLHHIFFKDEEVSSAARELSENSHIPGIGITYINKQVSAEAILVLYQSTPFFLSMRHSCRDFFDLIGPSNASNIRYLVVTTFLLGLRCEDGSGPDQLERACNELASSCPWLTTLEVYDVPTGATYSPPDVGEASDMVDDKDRTVPGPNASEVLSKLKESIPTLRTTRMIFFGLCGNFEIAEFQYRSLAPHVHLMRAAEKAGWDIVRDWNELYLYDSDEFDGLRDDGREIRYDDPDVWMGLVKRETISDVNKMVEELKQKNKQRLGRQRLKRERLKRKRLTKKRLREEQ